MGEIAILACLASIAVAFFWPNAAIAIFIAVALMWLVPDKSFEQFLE